MLADAPEWLAAKQARLKADAQGQAGMNTDAPDLCIGAPCRSVAAARQQLNFSQRFSERQEGLTKQQELSRAVPRAVAPRRWLRDL